MNRPMKAVLCSMFAVVTAGAAVAGSLDSPGAPSAGSGMPSLLDIYNYLAYGTPAPTPGAFKEPGSGPTAGTTKTLKEIYDAVATPFPQCPVTAADVKLGVKFFSTVPGSWGVQTGTLIPSWYQTYGPAGEDKVVQIGNMYVAKWTNNAGTDSGALKTWANASTWAAGLNWLGKASGWRLPSPGELLDICHNRASIGSGTDWYYWAGSGAISPQGWGAMLYWNADCGVYYYPDYWTPGQYAVRAVRNAE